MKIIFFKLKFKPLSDYWTINIGQFRIFPSLNGFKWTTGEPFNYANWGLGQPGVIPGDFVWFWDPTGRWFDSPSLLSRRYIVEFEGGLQNKLIAGIQVVIHFLRE